MRRIRSGVASTLLPTWAFFRIGYLDARAYPMSNVINLFGHLTNVFLYFFVAKLVPADQVGVAGNYFEYAVVGVLVLRTLGAGLEEFGLFIQRTIDQGQMELYIAQPMRWTALPFAWFQWPLAMRMIGAGATVMVAMAMGADFRFDRWLIALVVLALGVAATHAIGIIAASVRILSKRRDPVLFVYSVAASVFSGLFVPVSLLPRPLQLLSWLTPHTFAVDALRLLVLDDAEDSARVTIGQAMFALTAFCLVAYALGLFLFIRSLRFAREHGLIGAY